MVTQLSSSLCSLLRRSVSLVSVPLLLCSRLLIRPSFVSPSFLLYFCSPSLHPPCSLFLFFSLLTPHPFSPLLLYPSSSFYSQRMHAFSGLLQEDSNGQRASWWRGISAARCAPLIETAPLCLLLKRRRCLYCTPLLKKTVNSVQGNDTIFKFKWIFFISSLQFCNFVIKPPDKL